MKIYFIIFILSACSIFSPAEIYPQSLNLPLNHWGYDFLERLETKGLFKEHDLRAKPVSREVIAQIIKEIDSNLKSKPGSLTDRDYRLFEQLKGDFVDELSDRFFDSSYPKERHVGKWTKERDALLYFDLYGKQSIISNRFENKNDELLSETILGGIIRGQLGSAIGVYLDAQNAVTRGRDLEKSEDETFDPSQGLPVNITGQSVFQDKALAYFILEKPWLRFEIGQDEIDWGIGHFGGLALSNNMPPADLIKFGVRFKRFKFTSVHASLRSGLGAKYFAAHRLDLMIIPGLYLGAAETVVYGNRNIELSYLNPIMPYHIAEHHLGDKDNNTLSVDANIFPFPHTKFYGEFFIDDMNTSKNLLRYFGNKFAFLTGCLIVDPLKINNLDVRLEYTRVEPYVYAHDDSINIYTHYNKIIGFWLGPNSDIASLQFGYQLGRDLRFELLIQKIRKGQGEANSTDSRPVIGDHKKFLAGIVESHVLVGLKLRDQIRRDIFVELAYNYVNTRNADLIAGIRSHDHLVTFDFYFNY